MPPDFYRIPDDCALGKVQEGRPAPPNDGARC